MTVKTQIESITKPTSIALGVFDGVHIGHQAVIGEAVNGEADGLVPVVFTFDTSGEKPEHKKGQETILTTSLKRKKMEELGVSVIYEIPFDTVKDYSPAYFAEHILFSQLHAAKIVCGFDFRFGKNAAGNTELLKQLCSKMGIEVVVVPPMMDQGEPVSSTRIRHYLKGGDVVSANRLLGYEYSYDMMVVDGLKNGRKMGIPTINQEFDPGFLIPKFGVYASKVLVDGKELLGITNIGVKPTIQGVRNPLAETYIIGFDQNLYGRKIPVSLFQYLREEQKFHDLKELSATVKKDIDRTKILMKGNLKQQRPE